MNQEHIDTTTWQKQEVRNRLKDYRNNPEEAFDFDKVIDDIEKNL